ncbi:MAG: M1 family aminopeptidase [Myxococcaceae bacterium]
MPDIASRKFVETFQRAFSQSGRLSSADLKALETARGALTNATDKAAADAVMGMLRHDQELDAFEVAPMKKALGVLVGVTHGPLPADLAKALTHGVPQSNAAVKNYDLQFDVSGAGPDFPAKATITLDKAATKDLVLEANPERLNVSSVKVDGKDVPFTMKDGRLHVTAPGAKELTVAYTVKAVGKGDDAYGLIKDKYSGRMWTMTWPYNTGALFPSNSNPSDGVTTRVAVKVGQGFDVVGTGTKQADGTFATKSDSPAYAFAFYAAKDFQLGDAGSSKDGVAVTGFGTKSVPKELRDAYLQTARSSLDFYSSWLGQYDYGNTLKLVELEGGLGGMEHTGAVAIMLSSARDPDYGKETAAHETAHHWFGDNIRIKDWNDFWMSEGFTNYATYRFFRADQGEAKYQSLLDRSKLELRDALEANPHALSAPKGTDVNEIFDSVPYEMGPWMLRMMEVKLGTPKMDQLLKDWFQQNRQKTVSTDQFVAFAKKETGVDFADFFKEWNAVRAVPSFRADLTVAGSKVKVALKASTPVPKGLEVPLRLEGDGGKSKTVMVDPSKPLELDAGFPVKRTKWDPEHTVLAFVS